MQWRSFLDYIWILFHSNSSFRKVDTALLRLYVWENPYTISKRFLEERGETEVYAYGETPLRSMQHIVQECGLTSADTIFELGCGRGRTCFWLALCLHAKVIGIDYIPGYIKKAEQVRIKYGLEDLLFKCEDFLEADLLQATAIYLHGTCMSDADILRLSEKLLKLPQGTKVITVSFSLSDYPGGTRWELIKKFPAQFSWGCADVYLQRKR